MPRLPPTSGRLRPTTPATCMWRRAQPARVYRITPDGKATIIFEPKELQVQALQTGPAGAIYAATAPDGKVYKIEHKPGGKAQPAKADPPQDTASDKAKKTKAKRQGDKDAAKPAADPSWSSSVYFEPGTKYIWDLALDKAGNLYVATGDHGEIYRVTPKGEHSVFFKSDETHIRVLAFDAQENLIAGSDGSGLIYRISPAGEGFVLYSAPKKEITALALDRCGKHLRGSGRRKTERRRVEFIRHGRGSSRRMAQATRPRPARHHKFRASTITTAPSTPLRRQDRFRSRAAERAADRMYTASRRMVRLRECGPRTKISSMRWPSIRRGVCWRARAIAATFLPSPASDDFSDLLKAPASQVTAFAKAPGGGVVRRDQQSGKGVCAGTGPRGRGHLRERRV